MHLIARLGFGQGLGMLRLDGGEERKSGGLGGGVFNGNAHFNVRW